LATVSGASTAITVTGPNSAVGPASGVVGGAVIAKRTMMEAL
jgi:hypothetical protein